jgi:transcriptional regulator with XRE-family HTH domain
MNTPEEQAWKKEMLKKFYSFLNDHNISFRYAAKEIGVAATTVWYWKEGKKVPTELHFQKLRKFMSAYADTYFPPYPPELEMLMNYKEEQGISIRILSLRMGLPYSRLLQWFNGTFQPPRPQCEIIRDFLEKEKMKNSN